MKIINILLCLFIAFPSYARVEFNDILEASTTECSKDVEYLVEGSKAPCTGYLFSPKKEYEVRFKVKTYDHIVKIMKEQDELYNTMELRLQNAHKHNIYLSKELEKQKKNDFWMKTFYFSLGAVLTGVIASNVSR